MVVLLVDTIAMYLMEITSNKTRWVKIRKKAHEEERQVICAI